MKMYKIFFIISYLMYELCTGQKNFERDMEKMKCGIGGVTSVTYAGISNVLLMNATRYSCHGKIYEKGHSVRCTETIDENLTSGQIFCSQMPALQMGINKSTFVCMKRHPNDDVKMQCQGPKCKCLGGILKTLDELYELCGANYGKLGYLKYVYYPYRKDKDHVPVKYNYKHQFDDVLTHLNKREIIYV